PAKYVNHLLKAVAKLRTERDAQLVLVSNLTPGGPTERRISDLDISDSVRVVSGITDAELAELLASAEVACVPSLYEGFSLPTVEAMACGTPLVVSDTGALPEVVGTEDQCATRVPPGDTEALATALADLLADPQRRTRLGSAGRQRALDQYSWSSVAGTTTECYVDAVQHTPQC